ncbi:saccharopine dehydrogenase family protein [Aliikangiella maris]|uniref:Saccharopine dehydrogenase NADP-binding domain-containing protein n=2 Tax=Aliikangiella maris TaxID=3162458 RepID=A0ABV3MMF4_9GAMM
MQTKIKSVIILGGYGNFGKRIAQHLIQINELTIFIAGRSLSKAQNLCQQLQQSKQCHSVQPLQIDIDDTNFSNIIRTVSPDLLIHTSGPFQGQDYRVAQACIAYHCHYIDLADDRHFVSHFAQLNAQLNQQLNAKPLTLISGASSVPGLSSCVISTYLHEFDQLDSIEIAIAPGNQAERGLATLEAILCNTGKPLKIFINGQWQTQFGWMSSQKKFFGSIVGHRWLANVDVPDLQLFPAYYRGVQTVTFQAGLELTLLHHVMVLMAWLTKKQIIKNWKNKAHYLLKISQWFNFFGSDIGGMSVRLVGKKKNKRFQLEWLLTAPNGIGPYIPTIPAIIVAEKLIQGQALETGAQACINLFSIAEFNEIANPMGITTQLVCS